jgi:alanyl-tRNA synthetase
VRHAREDHDLLSRLSDFFSASSREVPALLESQRAELKRVTAENRELLERLAAYRAAELYAAAPPGAGGRRVVVVRESSGTVDRFRTLGQAVARMPGAVFLAAVANPPAVLLATAVDSGVDAGRVLKAALESEGGRGGGSARLAQGSLGNEPAVEAVVRAISG